jgi:hypothetical protein
VGHSSTIISSSCEEFVRVRTEIAEFDKSVDEVRESIEAFSNRLAKLPRITREFFAFLLERRDPDSAETLKITEDKLRRICSWPDIDGDIRLLDEAGLITVREQDSRHESYNVIMFVPGAYELRKALYEQFSLDFMEFMERKNLSFQKVIVNLDFGDF